MKCKICGAENEIITECGSKYYYRHCPNCELISVSPMPTDRQLNLYYQGFMFNKPREEELEKERKIIEKNVKKIINDLRKIKNIDDKTKLLDYGGGTGLYANEFNKILQAHYYDIDEKAKEYVKETSNVRIIKNLEDEDTKFDIIILNNVIEHLRNPSKTIEKLKAKLSKEGILIIVTPNQRTREYFFKLLWLYKYLKKGHFKILKFIKHPWIACDPPRHLYSFNERNIREIGFNLDLEVVSIFSEYSTNQKYAIKTYLKRSKTFKGKLGNLLLLMLIPVLKVMSIIDINKKYGCAIVTIMRRKRNEF